MAVLVSATAATYGGPMSEVARDGVLAKGVDLESSAQPGKDQERTGGQQSGWSECDSAFKDSTSSNPPDVGGTQYESCCYPFWKKGSHHTWGSLVVRHRSFTGISTKAPCPERGGAYEKHGQSRASRETRGLLNGRLRLRGGPDASPKAKEDGSPDLALTHDAAAPVSLSSSSVCRAERTDETSLNDVTWRGRSSKEIGTMLELQKTASVGDFVSCSASPAAGCRDSPLLDSTFLQDDAGDSPASASEQSGPSRGSVVSLLSAYAQLRNVEEFLRYLEEHPHYGSPASVVLQPKQPNTSCRWANEMDQSFNSVPPIIFLPGGGIFYFWKAGFVSYLVRHFDLSSLIFLGTSAGALVSALACCSVDIGAASRLAIDMAISAGVWKKPYFLAGCLHRIARNWLQAVIPREISGSMLESLRRRLILTAFRVSRARLEGLCRFADRNDLIECLLASIHIPFYANGRFALKVRGMLYIDGSFGPSPLKVFGRTLPPERVLMIRCNESDYEKSIPRRECIRKVAPEYLVQLLRDGYTYASKLHATNGLSLLQPYEMHSPNTFPMEYDAFMCDGYTESPVASQ